MANHLDWVLADPAKNTRARRLDSHRQKGLFRGFEFYPFRGRVSSLQPPVSPKGDDVAIRWAAILLVKHEGSEYGISSRVC